MWNLLCRYNNIYVSLHKYLKEKKKHKLITGKKKNLGTVEINVKILWTERFFIWFIRNWDLNCKDTIPLRPIDVFGLARERPLTIWSVESGLEKLGFGRGVMFRPRFWMSSYRKRSWVWMFKPYGVASTGIGLLGICPRTIEVSPRSPTAGFFYDLHVLLGCFHPWSSLFPGGIPPY